MLIKCVKEAGGGGGGDDGDARRKFRFEVQKRAYFIPCCFQKKKKFIRLTPDLNKAFDVEHPKRYP